MQTFPFMRCASGQMSKFSHKYDGGDDMMNRAAIYTRVSTERQAEEGYSLEAQRDILIEIAVRKGLEIYREYSDPGISGGSFKRPGIQMMLQDMKARKFDTIIVHKLDRLSRNMGDLYEFISMVNKLDVRLIIAAQGSEEIDTRSPMGKAFLYFSGIWAEMYLDNLREETLKGLTKKIQKGGRHMSRPPLGYTYDENNKLVIVEEEAKLVREVFRLYTEKLWGLTKIAVHMNKVAMLKEGGKWDNKAVRNILTNYTYAGYNHFKPEHWPEEKRIIVEGDHEPIISRETFEKAKNMRHRRSLNYMSRRSWDYPFSGIVKCWKCGATFAGNMTKKKLVTNELKIYRNYRCLNMYARRSCDAPGITEKNLLQLVFDAIMIMDDHIQDSTKKHETKIDLHKEIEISNRRKKNWMMALGDGKLSPEDYAMLIDEEDERMRNIYREYQLLNVDEQEIPVEELKAMMLQLKENWDYLEVGTQKELIQSMFRKIVISKESGKWEIVEILTA